MIEGKPFRTFIRICHLFRSEHVRANINLTLHKALIRLVITYVCPAWELATDTYLLKLQLLQNKILRTIGNFPRPAICSRLPTFHMYTITKENYAGNKQKSYKIMRMNMFVV
jgi:hypothetical protein